MNYRAHRLAKRIGAGLAGVLVVCVLTAVAMWVIRPESEVVVVNSSSSSLRGTVDFDRRSYDLGLLQPGERRRFGYRWTGPDGDFGLKVRLDSGAALQGRVGYVDGLLDVGASDEIVIEDARICLKQDIADRPADQTAELRARSDIC